jgi:hypothetical protein
MVFEQVVVFGMQTRYVYGPGWPGDSLYERSFMVSSTITPLRQISMYLEVKTDHCSRTVVPLPLV